MGKLVKWDFQNVEFLFGRIYLDENISKIKYLLVADSKIYKVKDIDFRNLTIEASETNLTIADVPEDELFPVEMFGEFKVRLINGDGKARVIDFVKWVKRNKGCQGK